MSSITFTFPEKVGDKTFDEYKQFIQKMLELAQINEEYRVKFTNDYCMQIFLIVVTHPTFDSENNYQELEFIGDGIIKGILCQYIPRRFPNLKQMTAASTKKSTYEGILSKIRRMLEQGKTLSDIALKLGFWDYVRSDQDTKATKRKKTLEDVCEAFIGALVTIIDTQVPNGEGLGYKYCYNFIRTNMDDIDVPITTVALSDPVTRLNELYKMNDIKGSNPLKWGDAIYNVKKLFLPIVNSLPLNTVDDGTLVYYIVEKAPFIYRNNKWIPFYNSKIGSIIVNENVPENEKQSVMFVGVYGFFDNKGNIKTSYKNNMGIIVPTVPLKKTVENLINEPERYGAKVIGYGISFTGPEAKKNAALQALQTMEKYGFSPL